MSGFLGDLVNGGCDPGANPISQMANLTLNGQKMSELARETNNGMMEKQEEMDDVEVTRIPQNEIDKYLEGAPVFRNDFDEEAFQRYLEANQDMDDHFDHFPLPPDVDWSSDYWTSQFDSVLTPIEDYSMSLENPYVNHPNPLEEGHRLFQAGNLGAAILAFEAQLIKLRSNANEDRSVISDTWRWLGTAHAENDEDKRAIQALNQSVKADPENLEALLDIGVSLTNELAQGQAITHLKNWLRMHPEFRNIAGLNAEYKREAPFGFRQEHEELVSLFLEARSIDPNDPDVHTVLGVLYNLSREYDKAEECFKAALRYTPQNYTLWNKLGATQANSPKPNGSEEAVQAYRKALELKPNYVRAWVNLGISYGNQGKYDLAAKYYGKGLTMNPTSDHIWSYIRLAFTCLNNNELVCAADNRDLPLLRELLKF